MASRYVRRMKEVLEEIPKVGLLREEDNFEEEAAAGSVSSLAERCGGLTLAGGVESGGFKLPTVGGGRGGGLDPQAGGGLEEVVSRILSTAKGNAWGGVVVAMDPFWDCSNWLGWDGCCLPWLATEGVGDVCGENNLRCWRFRGCDAIRVRLVMWGGVWDVGWKSGRRVGPGMKMVGGGGEGSGGPPGPIV